VALLSPGLIIVITLLYPIITFPVVQSVNALISGNDQSPSLGMRRIISLSWAWGWPCCWTRR
jgi:hypothetical protein